MILSVGSWVRRSNVQSLNIRHYTVEVVKTVGLKCSAISIMGHLRCCNFSANFIDFVPVS